MTAPGEEEDGMIDNAEGSGLARLGKATAVAGCCVMSFMLLLPALPVQS